MCSIFGVWKHDGAPVDLLALKKATMLLRHCGPNNEAYLLVNIRQGQTFSCTGRDTNPSLNLTPIEAFQYRQSSSLDLFF